MGKQKEGAEREKQAEKSATKLLSSTGIRDRNRNKKQGSNRSEKIGRNVMDNGGNQ